MKEGADRRPSVNVAIVGLGAMGEGLLRQTISTPDIRCLAVADIRLEQVVRRVALAGLKYRVTRSEAELRAAVAAGVLAVCEQGDWLARCAEVDVLLESASAVAAAAETCLTAIGHGCHVVLMNAELDLVFGPQLHQAALRHGVVCTSCDGDQHGVLKRLYDEVVDMGLEPVMLGNVKGFLDRRANPTSIIREADQRRLDYRMCTGYTDGSKLGVEMALLANALGLRCAEPGMIGPRAAHIKEVFQKYDLAALHDEHGCVVDYLLGAEPGGGVFLVAFCDDPYQRDMLAYYKMGPGPYYLFSRPYHLCHLEGLRTVREAMAGVTLLAPWQGRRTEVVAYAKRALRAGESLDGMGGYACYGQLENLPAEPEGLPLLLSEGLVLRHDLPADRRLTLDDVEPPHGREDWTRYRHTTEACGVVS